MNRLARPIAAMNGAARIRFTPGTLVSRRISGHESACWAIDIADLPREVGSSSASERRCVDDLLVVTQVVEPDRDGIALGVERRACRDVEPGER